MMQPARIEQLKERCKNLASIFSLNTDFILKLYDEIINEACSVEQELMER